MEQLPKFNTENEDLRFIQAFELKKIKNYALALASNFEALIKRPTLPKMSWFTSQKAGLHLFKQLDVGSWIMWFISSLEEIDYFAKAEQIKRMTTIFT